MKTFAVLAAAVALFVNTDAFPQQTTMLIKDAKPGEVRMLITNSIRGPIEAVIADASKTIGKPIVIQWGSARRDLKETALSGQPFEVAMLVPDVDEDLLKAGRIMPGSAEIARVDVGIGLRGDAPPGLDVSTPAKLKEAMLKARSIKYSPLGAALLTVRKVLSTLQIAETIKDSSRVSEPVALGPGEYELNFYPLSEILKNKDLVNLGPVTAELQVPVIVTAVVGKKANDEKAARALIKFLQGPTIDAALASNGMTKGYAAQLYTRPINDFKDIKYPAPFDKPQIAPEIPFDPVDPNWFKLPPAQINWNVDFGEVAAVTSNSKGHVFVLNRNDTSGNVHGASATQVLEFDDKGNYVREIGHGQYSLAYGHGIRADKDDNIWVVDKGTNMVTKFNAITGKVMMVLGRRDETNAPYWLEGKPDLDRPAREGFFAEPTDVAWDSKGNIYVSDGYVNSRVAKFDPDGHWIGTWGRRGIGPGEFRTPHAIQVDANDHIWVADRSNGRIQIFDTNGQFLREIILNVPTRKYQPLLSHQYPPTGDTTLKDAKQPGLEPRPGSPYALCSPPDNRKIMFVGDIYPGRIYKVDLSGKVLGYFGHVGKRPGDTGSLHGLACPKENTLYTAEFINDRVQRFVIHPEKAKITSN